jgi:hypothetical protein
MTTTSDTGTEHQAALASAAIATFAAVGVLSFTFCPSPTFVSCFPKACTTWAALR